MTNKKFTSCYESHAALPVGEFKIYGGNCGTPVHLDCHVYVALQSGSKVGLPLPWEDGFGKIVQVEYPIKDMGVPGNAAKFGKMIDWLCTQLQAGKKVHVGCIGGHGRTGMVLAAVVAKMMPDELDAIGYVRKNYCHKAVESSEQVQFLHKHFGCKVVSGAKEGLGKMNQVHYAPYHQDTGWQPRKTASEFKTSSVTKFAGALRTVDPVPSRRNIFAERPKTP